MSLKNNNRPIDVAYEGRREAREKQGQDEKRREAKEEQDEYDKLKIEHEQLVKDDIPEAEQGAERANQVLQEPPAIPPEGRVKMNIVKGAIYVAFSALATVAGAVLAFSVVNLMLYLFPRFFRWLIAFVVILMSIMAFHWAVKELRPKLHKVLVFILLFIVLLNFGALGWLRAEYSKVQAQQEGGELTAAQVQEKTEELDWIVILVHTLLAVVLESIGALAASRAAGLFDDNLPDLGKYRRLRYWERKYQERHKRQIALDITLKRFKKNMNGK